MAIADIYSKRQKKNRGEAPDVYQYDHLPEPLRVQIIHIFFEMFGRSEDWTNPNAWKYICETLCREYGVFVLPGTTRHIGRDYHEELTRFIISRQDIEQVLDAVEIGGRIIDSLCRDYKFKNDYHANENATNALNELNSRFKEHAVGYQFEQGELIRTDSMLLHSEVIKPALNLLNRDGYDGPQDEFLKAYEHYRHGNNKEALNECLKSFESMMKAICTKRGWPVTGQETASNLIKTCLEHELIPSFWQTQFTSLRSLLESGIPTARNKLGGHGQGAETTAVPSHLVSYMLHMTGACIVFLSEAEQEL